MSVKTTQFLMYGLSIPFPKGAAADEFSVRYEEFMCGTSSYTTKVDHHEGLYCLFDGMSGNYCVIGVVLVKTNNDRPFLADGKAMALPHLSKGMRQATHVLVRRHFKDYLKEQGINADDSSFELYLVTHYS